MKSPVRILSDLHLGHRVSRIERVESLRPLIAGAGTVVFNGDTWQELAAPFREKSTRMLEELRTLCREENAEPVFLSGNHDPGWPGTGWLELAGGKIVVTHGDALFFDGSPWSREAIGRQAKIRELWQEHHQAACDVGERLQLAREIARNLVPRVFPRGKKLWQRAWEAAHPPERALKMLHAWLTQADAAATFCDRYFPRAEVFVMGHFHHEGIWHRGHRLILNTGGFLNPAKGLLVDWDNGWLSCRRIHERGEHRQPGEILGRWRIS